MPATQTQRVLRVLERRGERGVTQIDFTLPDVIDGGPPVLRLASRVSDLRAAGHWIVREMTATSGGARIARYRHVGTIVGTPAAGCAPEPEREDAQVQAQQQLTVEDVLAAAPAPGCAVYSGTLD